VKIKQHIYINAPAAKVYSLAESYPLFVDEFLKKEIVSSSDTESHVRVTNKIFNIPFMWEGIGQKDKKNMQIRWVQTKGLFQGMSVVWSISPKANESAEVVIEGSLASDKWFSLKYLLAKLLIPKAVMRILHALKKHSECIP
jgi:ribosome-associated toxin RatA of RatAB toxin-antitoxin module